MKKINWRLDAGQIEVVDDAIAAILRQKTAAERIGLAAAAHRTARAIITAQVQSAHPEWSVEDVQREATRRLSGGAN